eukprot:3736371-Rhodomonas_salina.2
MKPKNQLGMPAHANLCYIHQVHVRDDVNHSHKQEHITTTCISSAIRGTLPGESSSFSEVFDSVFAIAPKPVVLPGSGISDVSTGYRVANA